MLAEGPPTTIMPRQGLCEGTFGIFVLYGCVGAVGRFLRRQRRWRSRWAKDRRDTSSGEASLGSRWGQSLATPEDFRRQTLPEGNPHGGVVTGENVPAVCVLRRAPISAGHTTVSNSKGLNFTFPQRLRDTQPTMREQAF